MWEKFGSKRNWSWHDWCISKFHDFCVLAWYCDLVVCSVKNEKPWFCKTGWTQSSQMPPKWCGRSLWSKGIDLGMVGAYPSSMILVFCLDFVTWWCVRWKTKNHGFAKLARVNPHKCLQSDVGDVWDQKELILAWLVQSQVPWFRCFGLISWLGGVWAEKLKSWFCKSGWTKSSQMPPKLLEKFERERNWSWYGWCKVEIHDFGVFAWFCDLVVCSVKNKKPWFCKTGWTQSWQMPLKWYGRSLGPKGIDFGLVGAKPSSMISVFWLDIVTWWCVGWKTKIMVL